MFKCQICGTLIANTPAQRVTLETRVRTYPPRKAVHIVPTAQKKRPRSKELEYADDPGGIGLEIVREGLACPDCATRQR